MVNHTPTIYDKAAFHKQVFFDFAQPIIISVPRELML